MRLSGKVSDEKHKSKSTTKKRKQSDNEEGISYMMIENDQESKL